MKHDIREFFTALSNLRISRSGKVSSLGRQSLPCSSSQLLNQSCLRSRLSYDNPLAMTLNLHSEEPHRRNQSGG
jgi:hypothetical protein